MDKLNRPFHETTRRRFLAASGAAVLATGLTARRASAAQGPPVVRKSLLDPQIGPVLDSYKKGIAAMLALPPTDPRNWYRNAFIHELDCPHGNWWFLPWHRGYIGYLECTIRELSGDPYFALPYWDWTADPGLPAQFASTATVLNPANSAYIASSAAFSAAFSGPVNTMYGGFNAAQLSLLTNRGLPDAASFTQQIMGDFFPGLASRNLNFGPVFQNAVSQTMINSALAPTVFSATGNPAQLNFASDPAPDHEQSPGDGILEAQPHNMTHNAVGGLMGQFLSPADPIFFMHHSNIDRLWDVWTRKQQAAGGPILPQGADLAPWSSEPFLFYVDCQGNPPTKTTAGDYTSTSVFNYTYTKGSGENVIPTVAPAALALHPQIATTLSRNMLDFAQPTTSTANVPAAAMRSVGVPGGRELVAKIALELPAKHSGLQFHVLVNPSANEHNIGFNDPSFAGTIAPFGSHFGPHAMPMTVNFDVPLTGAIAKLRAANKWDDSKPIDIQVVPDTAGVTAKAFTVPVKSISLHVI
jgi:tyrosinase